MADMARQMLSDPNGINHGSVIALHRQLNNLTADPMIPSLDRRQSRHHQAAQLSRIIRRSASASLSSEDPGSQYLPPPSILTRPASAYGHGNNLTRPLSGIREISEPGVTRRRTPSRQKRRHVSHGQVDGMADYVPRKPRVNRATAPATVAAPVEAPVEAAVPRNLVLPPSTLPERKSSRRLFQIYNARTPRFSMDVPSLVPPPPSNSGQTITSRGPSDSPVKAAAARLDPISSDMERIPSKTFVRTVRPSDILEFSRIRHPRVAIDMSTPTPVFMGGGTVEGQLHIVVDGGEGQGCRKSKGPISLGRITVDVLGVEEISGGKRWIFRSLATELIDQAHPPPANMVTSTVSPADAFWELVSSAARLPFRLNLPVNMGPPPYHSKAARIRYVLCTSVLIKVAGEPFQVRESQDIAILSVHDPERALVNLPNPLTAYDELEVSQGGETGFIKLTAGLHRQTWLSGINLWVDVHVSNTGQKTVKRLEVQLEKVTLYYDHSGASAVAEDAVRLRLPDRRDKEVVSRWVLKKSNHGWKGVAPKSSEVRTIEVDIPRGLVTVTTGRFFEVRYFLKVQISSTFSKLLAVQLPVTIIHPNSVDIVPNSLAQVAAAIEDINKDAHDKRPPSQGSTTTFTQARAFTAARKQSLSHLTAGNPQAEAVAKLARQPPTGTNHQKLNRRRSSSDPIGYSRVSKPSTRLDVEDSSQGHRQHHRQHPHHHRRTQSSSGPHGRPRMQTSTSGTRIRAPLHDFRNGNGHGNMDGHGQGNMSDLNGAFEHLTQSRRIEDGQLQRELSIAHKRSRDLGSGLAWRNIALEEAEKAAERGEISWI